MQWQKLGTAHGAARDVPKALAKLVSVDPAVRERGYRGIDNVVVLQSDLYEAAPYVALALLEMLAARPEFGREQIHDLLFEIGNGYSPDEWLIVLPNGMQGPLTQLSRRVMEGGLSLYEEDLLSEDRAVRKQVLDVVGSFELRKAEAMGSLRSAMDRAVDSKIGAEIAKTLSEMTEA